jgi:asparagine synthase (glutamine-hydrolysing)
LANKVNYRIMCGILAIFSNINFSDINANVSLNTLKKRGPDGFGVWRDSNVFLGHTRLSIIDLDLRSSQPMKSICGRYIIIFNGEIYNYAELKSDLEIKGSIFKTQSDTEVLLALFSLEGEQMLCRLHGMFAFVIWDNIEMRAFAARDPYGIKPLYIGYFDDGIILSSQVKTILSTSLISVDKDELSISKYWLLGSLPEPDTCFKNIKSLESGHYIWIKDNKIQSNVCWKNIANIWNNVANIQHAKNEFIQDLVTKSVKESISRHLIADVPIGIFLSGGIDSGVLAGLMVEAGVKNMIGVTIAYKEFANSNLDESIDAKNIAKHFGIKHHIRYVTKQEFFNDLPKIFEAMDQPSIDGINTWFATKAIAELGIKVVISGVGGDELFMGYNSFHKLPLIVKYIKFLYKFPLVKPLIKLSFYLKSKLSKNNRWLDASDLIQTIDGCWLMSRSISSINTIKKTNNLDFNYKNIVNDMTGRRPKDNHLALSQIESMTYLRNQLLRDSDWASMAHSVELRTPLVDMTLLENLSPILGEFKKFPHKILLSNTLKKSLPKSILTRKKTGFSIPINTWLKQYQKSNKTWNEIILDNYFK